MVPFSNKLCELILTNLDQHRLRRSIERYQLVSPSCDFVLLLDHDWLFDLASPLRGSAASSSLELGTMGLANQHHSDILYASHLLLYHVASILPSHCCIHVSSAFRKDS